MVSVAAGVRYVITDKEMDLHGTYSGADIQAKYDQEADGFGGVIGIDIHPSDKLRLKSSFTLYFEEGADWGSQNNAVNGNSFDLALALQYDVNADWSLTAGYLYIDVDMKPENFGIIEQMNPPLDCHAFAVGARYRMTEQITLILGAAGYFYKDAPAPADHSKGRPKVTYGKTLYQGGIGILYRF